MHERMYDEFMEKTKAHALKRVVGDPFRSGVEQGPQVRTSISQRRPSASVSVSATPALKASPCAASSDRRRAIQQDLAVRPVRRRQRRHPCHRRRQGRQQGLLRTTDGVRRRLGKAQRASTKIRPLILFSTCSMALPFLWRLAHVGRNEDRSGGDIRAGADHPQV